MEKAKTESNGCTDSSALDDVSKRHAEELMALEEKLKAEHLAELQARIESAVENALKARPAAASDPPANAEAQKTAIDAAIAEFKKDLEARHAEEIASAVDRGRMEQATKGKLKDSQLVRAQKKVKDLEAQIAEWQAAGLIPTTSSAAVPPVATAATQAAAKPAAVNSVVTPATGSTVGTAPGPSQAKPNLAAAATAAAAPNGGNLPRRPLGANVGAGGVPIGRGGGPAGRGRGGPPGVGRGGTVQRTAPVRQQPAAAAAAAPTGGVSIMGAAGKRPHEDAAGAVDGSLAKRLKPTQPS